MAIKKQKRCRKIRPVSAFIKEESSLLPGFGGARGSSFCRKMGTDPDQEDSTQAWQKRRSSDDAGPGAWKPPPPPQSSKPSFSAMRRAEATWHIAEESAANHSCQSPSPASQDGDEEKQGALFPERMVPTRNAKLQEPPIGPRPPKPVAVPRGRRAPQVPGGREETESSSAAPGANKPRLRLGSQQDQEEPEGQGPTDQGRRTAPLKPKRTRRAQSCDKLEPDRRQPPDPTGVCGTSEPGTD
ncbi:mCG133741 [Mus musculus]|nr:mCG133741 [Mus musculus]